MSFPAFLRNPGIASRYAHLIPGSVERAAKPRTSKADSGHGREGKRRIRRRENAKFTSNPHVVPPSAKDYAIAQSAPKRTFPQPIPRSLRSTDVPEKDAPSFDPASAKAGQFTLTLKGMRKELRRNGPMTEGLVLDVEAALLDWLEKGDVVIFAASGVTRTMAPDTLSFSTDGPIREVERTPARLVWAIEENAYARYIVHCVCRWHSVVSYSESAGQSNRQLH
ncbi:hypothetical protein DL93DRAFT_2059054 [Clavulina sp. PMI_390]|nr:hypothetical protein DL93DRAFT_2059054 [Clavulina sp. PMI_390]